MNQENKHQNPQFSFLSINEKVNLIQNLLLISSILGTIIGAITTAFHLNKINQTSILPNVFNDTTNLLTIMFAFGILWLIWLLICIIPFLLAIFWLNKNIEINKNKKIYKNIKLPNPFFILFILPSLILLLCIFAAIMGCWLFSKIIFFMSILSPTLFSLLLWYSKKQQFNPKFNLDFYIATAILPTALLLLFLLFSFSTLGNWIISDNSSEYKSLLFLVVTYLIALVLNPWLAGLFVGTGNLEIKNNPNKIIAPTILISSIICFILYTSTVLLTPNFSGKVLGMLHFTEAPANSAWYLINNSFQKTDGTQEISGINQYDLNKIKASFINPSIPKPIIGKLCLHDLPIDRSNCYQNLSNHSRTLSRSNALHGYMAWNLGNTKVFCPERVKFTDNARENKQLSKQCLLIDGKYLQILDEQYITSDLKP